MPRDFVLKKYVFAHLPTANIMDYFITAIFALFIYHDTYVGKVTRQQPGNDIAWFIVGCDLGDGERRAFPAKKRL